MNSKVTITCSFFVPLLEVPFEDQIRKELEFLTTSKKICAKLEQLYFQKKEKKLKNKPDNNVIFIPKIGSVDISLKNENYNYYRLIREDVCSNEPIRPLVIFSTSYIKWKPKNIDFKTYQGQKKAEIYLNLVGCITKKLSFNLHNNQTDIESNVNTIVRSINNKKSTEKRDLLNAVYNDITNIYVTESDLMTIVEVSEDQFYKLSFQKKRRNSLVINGLKVCFLDFNKIILVNSKKQSKLFIRRIIQTFTLVFSLKVLADRALKILDKNVFQDKQIEKKFEFYEYMLAVLDPNSYTTIDNLKILPNHYQRILFNETAQRFSYFSYADKLEEKLILSMKSWELREQIKFLSRGNKIVNRLRFKFKIERDQVTEPPLTTEERVVLRFLIDKYCSNIAVLGVVGKKLHTKTPIGSVSRNILREEINPWMKSKNIATSIIAQSAFRGTNPKILERLINKGLVEFKKPEKGRTTLLYYLNENDSYIQARLRAV